MGALPPRPPPPINGRPSHHRLLPALPCRPGETFLVAAVRSCFFFAGRWPDRFHFFRCGKTCTPGPQGGPGRRCWGDMSKFYIVRGPGGLPARAILSRVCAIRRSTGNGRSVSKAVPLFTSPKRRYSMGALLSPRPVHRVETVATFSVPFWSVKKEHRQRLDAVNLPAETKSFLAYFFQ